MAVQTSPAGNATAQIIGNVTEIAGVQIFVPTHMQRQRENFVRDDEHGHYRHGRERLLHHNKRVTTWQRDFLAWLRDHVHRDIPSYYYHLVIGHDLHISEYAETYVRLFHHDERDPYTNELGWWENLGRCSSGKVTVAFRNFEVAQLVAESSLYGDFKYHEVGLSAQAESNADTALISTTGIARVAGTQVDAGSGVYRSVASITADATETWQEHGLFNAATSITLLDRGLLSPTVSTVSGNVCQITYELTKSAES